MKIYNYRKINYSIICWITARLTWLKSIVVLRATQDRQVIKKVTNGTIGEGMANYFLKYSFAL